jgi:hypothetical protein
MPVESAPGGKVKIPPANRDWHPVAKGLYLSLRSSGQAVFYESSDWATAYLLAESISRELSPQPVVGKEGEVSMVSFPPKGASLGAWSRLMTALMVTEGDRRRLRLELERSSAGGEEGDADVSELAEYRRRLGKSG